MWHDYIHHAMQELHPGASLAFDYQWVSTEDGPEMVFWNEDKLGPLDLAALQARAEELMNFVPPPAPITRRQLRLWLVRNGVTTLQVETVIAAIQPEQDREEAWIEWQDASSYERTNPLVAQVGQALGLTDAQMDAAFREAATF